MAVWVLALPLAAQQPIFNLDLSRYDGARFVETVHSDVVTQSGSAERHRSIDRATTYSMQQRGDTLVVTIDTMALRENDEGQVRDINVDPVIGARWKLVPSAGDQDTIVDQPFVPDAIAEVSDVDVAMKDFFPNRARKSVTGASPSWQHLADSAGMQRWRWSYHGRVDSTAVGVDSDAAPVQGEVHDDGTLAWSARRGFVVWRREVDTDFTSRVAGRVVRGTVKQAIMVQRIAGR
jgi:hypothetical protein